MAKPPSMGSILSGKGPTKAAKAKKTPKAASMPTVAMSGPKSVRIEKAENGFTVSCYTGEGEKSMVAKSSTEAVKHAKGMLGE